MVQSGAGVRIRLPIKGRDDPIEIAIGPRERPVSADVPARIDPAGYDLAVLAMQEPQCGAPGVRDLLGAIARKRTPCMSIMNMPPPYLERLPAADIDAIGGCFTDLAAWRDFSSDLMALCSPDPQAFGPPDQPSNVLQVSLPTTFKAAPFASSAHTALLRDLQADIEGVRYRCVQAGAMRSIHDAVHSDLAQSRTVYEWVSALCRRLGATEADQVPFE